VIRITGEAPPQARHIAIRSGIPHHQALWGWRCGFYPGSEPGEFLSGTATAIEQARAGFAKAWQP
jgi:hypothetical protein